MLQEEFEKRVNFKVSSECYYTLIDPEYNKSNLDKDTWCKQWKKKGGIQEAYNFEITRFESMSEERIKLFKACTNFQNANQDLFAKIADLRKELSQTKDEVSKWKNLYINLIARMKGLINDFEIF